jgi:hypothetical protein
LLTGNAKILLNPALSRPRILENPDLRSAAGEPLSARRCGQAEKNELKHDKSRISDKKYGATVSKGPPLAKQFRKQGRATRILAV